MIAKADDGLSKTTNQHSNHKSRLEHNVNGFEIHISTRMTCQMTLFASVP